MGYTENLYAFELIYIAKKENGTVKKVAHILKGIICSLKNEYMVITERLVCDGQKDVKMYT